MKDKNLRVTTRELLGDFKMMGELFAASYRNPGKLTETSFNNQSQTSITYSHTNIQNTNNRISIVPTQSSFLPSEKYHHVFSAHKQDHIGGGIQGTYTCDSYKVDQKNIQGGLNSMIIELSKRYESPR